ncbi:hypothetical protein E2562_017883 [Oryza meyeriana var. granulata]|uniref:Casein kinase substrate phosphoprotein PP28 domain-containing protein n=1 Tax=Oryza meyeriana var. granulata TaxID=110450 RepID=A0A6G1CQZ3_9ORYZ|nr:hypothetical protein E2562_017883 [Oryza meyeriana var. granulata]
MADKPEEVADDNEVDNLLGGETEEGVTMSDKEADEEEENKIKQRLRDRADKKAMDLATERKEAQNAFINKGHHSIPSNGSETTICD